jgi:nitrite reductase (NADH) large subunit
MDRVGLDSIKARVMDDIEGRRALCARFQHSQLHSQDDPWAERAAGADEAEFQGIRAPMLQAAE